MDIISQKYFNLELKELKVLFDFYTFKNIKINGE